MPNSAFVVAGRSLCRVAGLPHAIVLALVLVAMTLALSSPAVATPNYDWPGMKKCGSFSAQYRIYVYANKRLTCKRARRVIKALWLPEPGSAVPGWRCYSGAGGGTCRRGKAVAGYQN